MNALEFNQRISNIETTLSYCAVIPVVGTIPGSVKVALGAIQLVSASFVLLYSKVSKDTSLQNHAWTHIVHGAGNMVAGTLEAIPVVGSIMGAIRFFKQERGNQPFAHTLLSQRGKFKPYDNLVQEENKKGPAAPIPSNRARTINSSN